MVRSPQIALSSLGEDILDVVSDDFKPTRTLLILGNYLKVQYNSRAPMDPTYNDDEF